MPVGNGGHFSAEMANIYDLVHEMQAAAFNIIKPDVHWDIVHLECHKVLIRGFQKLGLFKKVIDDKKSGSIREITEDDILMSEVTAAFFPHGLGHSLGMDVHDVAEASKPELNDTIPNDSVKFKKIYSLLRLRLPLEAGMVVVRLLL
jgi:Xaa-Pro dipeptidase